MPTATPAFWRRLTAPRTLAIVALVVFAYALLGFALLPWVARQQIVQFAEQTLGQKAGIGDLRFNPFSFELEATDVRLDTPSGAPLAGFDRLYVNFEPTGVFRRAWRFASIQVDEPRFNAERRADGRLNWAEVLAALPPGEEKDPNAPPPRLLIDHVELRGGQLDFADRTLRQPFVTRVAPLDFRLDSLSTLPEDKGPYTLSAALPEGGTLRWKGEVGLNPVSSDGEVALEGYTLTRVSNYLRQSLNMEPLAGKLGLSARYRLALQGETPALLVDNAQATLQDFALRPGGAAEPLLALQQVKVGGVRFDLAARAVDIGNVDIGPGEFRGAIDAQGRVDWAALATPAAGTTAAPEAPPPPAAPAAKTGAPDAWNVKVGAIAVDGLRGRLEDARGALPAAVAIGGVGVRGAVEGTFGTQALVRVNGLEATVKDVALTAGGQEPWLRLGQIALTGGTVDTGARRFAAEALRAGGARMQAWLDESGKPNWLALLPPASSTAAQPATAAPSAKGGELGWAVAVGQVELTDTGIDLSDRSVKPAATLNVEQLRLAVDGVSNDLAQPLGLQLGFRLRQGGSLEASGRVVPGTPEAEARLRLRDLALAPAQPYLARHVKLKLAGGAASTDLRVSYKPKRRDGELRVDGNAAVAKLLLQEASGERFLAWHRLDANDLTLRLMPGRLDIADLHLVGLDSKLIIKPDRSLNAKDILVEDKAPTAAAARPAKAEARSGAGADPFPVSVRRIRLKDGELDFADLSLQPQFATHIHELNGSIAGLGSSPEARAQVELDGRVDEYGQARARGTINLLAVKKHTDLGVVFRNVDMSKLTPYSGRFAGYKISSGKMSLDLKYKIDNSELAGDNQIILDQLTLGDHVDSPDAVKLPLELAIALLKDGDGRIDIGLPVKGSLDDPQFSYGPLVWKALTNFIVGIVAAPFRLLGKLLPGGGENLDSVDFDPGRPELLPPEREKLLKLAEALGKRPNLKLQIVGRYDPKADGEDLRNQFLRREVARRLNLQVKADERLPALALTDTRVQAALEGLYEERFSAADLRALRSKGTAGVAPEAGKEAGADKPAAPASIHAVMARQLADKWPLDKALLDRLAEQRAAVVLKGLTTEAKVDPARVATGAVEAGEAKPSGLVPIKFEVGSK